MPKRKKTGKQRVAEKIAIIHKEEPQKPMKAVVGKLYGMARGKGYAAAQEQRKGWQEGEEIMGSLVSSGVNTHS